jgi:hypothetical protein
MHNHEHHHTSCVDQHSDAHARAVGYMQTGCLCVQAMSSTLVRIEEMGPSGWEDRDTFMAVNRSGKPSVLLCFSSHSLSLSLSSHSPHSLSSHSLSSRPHSRCVQSFYTHTACQGASLIVNVHTRQRTECLSAHICKDITLRPTRTAHAVFTCTSDCTCPRSRSSSLALPTELTRL